ncbi:acetyl/propionyl/methylcrotonyl-CoA carboxylase subunit alpha [Methylocapsa sp. D3K7]|uniref:acetyl/propionyl/methylcrotonyl-CoA carboxylase subunit alpha n=1 Tax=Methylocapsa sp. D3K7 TaxID=3041435 RepID=UPI00244EF77B|nr:acetyl/propionyl/methylcrotonyl-CoA carboxylase subunit alpha [Methylocapsa sp. D3K7]WGJ16654.1 acetyl/propionyl/methylcrotonyl-CoA carboxylase subunit alpha [Methylocapsa sp. D3K7]
MFKKILIANRGEIACRVIATARQMGIATVAVYSDADRDALHVGMADEAVRIGPPPVAESYLAIENIIAACKTAGADAVHPGYGFLSEQATFPRALAASNIAFIGPNPRAIEAMGDKIEAKKLAQNAGVTTVPGFSGVIDDAPMAAAIAKDIGYPVILKASAGGGGRGMRIVESGEGIAEGFARATSEAKSAFGDGRVFMEKFIADPRHIEIQVLGDQHGNLIHLGERDCSIQRRHQKVIEEAPSPFIDEKTRDKMGEHAIALARAVKYDSAGTVEFIATQEGKFYFLEMNTRLQVEHRVTELITGIDIVEQMIRSAAGQRLALAQTDVRFEGSAIESRILAEDPGRNFLPSAGRLKTYRPPGGEESDGTALRIDSGVHEGDEVSIHYDSLIAKLVTHAPHRTTAIEAQARALDRFVIEGVANNIAFLASVMGHERFRAGRLSTGFIAEEYPRGFTPLAPQGEVSVLFACVAAAIDHVMNERKRKISGQVPLPQPLKFTRMRSVMLGKMRHDVTLDDGSEGLAVCFEETKRACLCVSHWVPGQPVWMGTIDSEALAVQVRPLLNGIHLTHGGFGADARVYTRREAELALLVPEKKPPAGSNVLCCSMPGLVKTISVIAGQSVRTGETLCIIEAMKMETAVCAEFDATVAKIHVQPGDILASDAIIMTFE